ncbi:MAG: transposase [Acidithiobacillus ferrivorans]
MEFGGESDHVHLLVEIHPALNISTLINNLKTASARRASPAQTLRARSKMMGVEVSRLCR